MRSSTEQQAVLQLAGSFHQLSYRDAVGRCFAAALALAEAARQHGMAVELVRWQVEGDRDFCDHWAVAGLGDTVIDPTRVQVDGKTNLLHPVESYPKHYRNLRRYPAALLLPLFAQLEVGRHDYMPWRFMWGSGLALVRYDMQCAYRAGQWRSLGRAMVELACVGWRTALGALQHQWLLSPPNRIGLPGSG